MRNDAGIGGRLGLEFAELTPGRVVATMPVDERHRQPFGYLHGGVSVVLAESVASVGGYLNCPPGKAAFGAEISASHVRPKRSGTLTAVGVPVHIGRTSQVWEIHIMDENDKTVCISRCTVAIADLFTTVELPRGAVYLGDKIPLASSPIERSLPRGASGGLL